MGATECISKLERWKFQIGKVCKCYGLDIDEVIKLLQMWDDLKSKYGIFFRDTEEGRCLGEMMAKMEYEYFPKPSVNTIASETIMSSNKEQIKKLTGRVERLEKNEKKETKNESYKRD